MRYCETRRSGAVLIALAAHLSLLTTACSDSSGDPTDPGDGNGAISIALSTPAVTLAQSASGSIDVITRTDFTGAITLSTVGAPRA